MVNMNDSIKKPWIKRGTKIKGQKSYQVKYY